MQIQQTATNEKAWNVNAKLKTHINLKLDLSYRVHWRINRVTEVYILFQRPLRPSINQVSINTDIKYKDAVQQFLPNYAVELNHEKPDGGKIFTQNTGLKQKSTIKFAIT